MESFTRPILTVSELTREIKDLLEVHFSEIWVEGEISNLRSAPSGHAYFTLKDEASQIRAVLFRNQARGLRFAPEDGLHVVCCGRVGLYEKKGEYQLILESMEPKGIGALQLAFVQLKEKLEKEGLFRTERKKPLPMLPQRIGIVTSPTGAVIRDMLHIIARRFENVRILLYPVRVQGEGASLEIAQGIEDLSRRGDLDVIIVARGGGSLEDLWAFNEEVVARAIYESRIPVISAVGHETDYTISDFVADLRAPTPSAAAEMVVMNKMEIEKTLRSLAVRLENKMRQILQEIQTHLSHMGKILEDPKKKIEDCIVRVDDLTNRILLVRSWAWKRRREAYLFLHGRLSVQSPFQGIERLRGSVAQHQKNLLRNIIYRLEHKKGRMESILGRLDSLSPLAILRRGYSITQKIPTLEIIRAASQVMEGERVKIRLHEGDLVCGVERSIPS